MRDHHRMWCAVGTYPGKRPLLFGTVPAPDRHAALIALRALWAETIPVPPPDLEPIPGELVFTSADSPDA